MKNPLKEIVIQEVIIMLNAIELYVSVASACIPYAVAFSVGNLIVGTFLKAAFGGKLVFG